jgi:hypothetical protein
MRRIAHFFEIGPIVSISMRQRPEGQKHSGLLRINFELSAMHFTGMQVEIMQF